jgi:hypothetical protein
MVRIPLDRAATRHYMLLQLRSSRLFDFHPRDLHAEEVADTVRNWLTQHYQIARGTFIPPDGREVIENAYHAGLLHELVEMRGCPFEALCDETNHAVALLVSDCSRDVRLPVPRRDDEFRSRISQARPVSQVLALADIMCTLRTALKWLDETPDDPGKDDTLLQLIPRMQSDLSALNQLDQMSHINRVYSAINKHAADAYDKLRDRIGRRRLAARVTARIAESPNGQHKEPKRVKPRPGRISPRKVPRARLD